VDLTEAIDPGDASFLDNADYHDVDAVPLNGSLPSSHYLPREVRLSSLLFSPLSSLLSPLSSRLSSLLSLSLSL